MMLKAILLSSLAVIVVTCTKTSDLIVGVREEGDELLFDGIITEESSEKINNSSFTGSIPTPGYIINRVEVLDKTPGNQQSATVKIVNGLGASNVSLVFTGMLNSGIYYDIKVYGKTNRLGYD